MTSNINNKKNTFGKSLDRMMESHHRRALAQSMAIVQGLHQQQEQLQHRPNLRDNYLRLRQHQSLASNLLAAWQSELLQHQRLGFSFPKSQAATGAPMLAAPAELAENNECIRLTIDLPGVYKKDVTVHVERGGGNVLTVQAVRRTFSVSGQVCIKKQRIARSFAIDTAVVNLAQISVTLNNGVLTIQAPKWSTRTTEIQQQKQQGEVVAHSNNISTTRATVPVNDEGGDDDVKTKVSFDSLDMEGTASSSLTRNKATTKN